MPERINPSRERLDDFVRSAVATATAVTITRPALKALSLVSRAELRRKHTSTGHPKNYAVVARRPASSRDMPGRRRAVGPS